ncbi:MAG: hypothetical protein AAGA42_02455 [Actinomycetota bacterium]
MTDAEFWEHVFGWESFSGESYVVDLWAIWCCRCGRTVEVDTDTAHERERDAFCDDCADEHHDDLEAE